MPIITASCAPSARRARRPSRRNTLYLAIPADAEGVSVTGEWDPLGMRGTVCRTLHFQDVFVPGGCGADAARRLLASGCALAAHVPDLVADLHGPCQAAYDFTVRYLRGEVPGTPPVKRRMYPTKQLAVAEMRMKLEAAKALWFQAVSEAGPDPGKDGLMRAWTAQYTVMETANDLARLAIRTCGGQAMLRSLPLERIYRDSRCGSLMLPWTAELCLDRLGRAALYEDGETRCLSRRCASRAGRLDARGVRGLPGRAGDARPFWPRLGVGAGDRVAVLAQNHPRTLALLFACARLGAMLAPLNWRLAGPELRWIIEHAAPRLLFADASAPRRRWAGARLPLGEPPP